MTTEPTHIPEALYSCAYRACAEENSFPAEHLHWTGEKWLCFSCCAHDGVAKGVSLADHLARKQPAADLSGYPVDVVEGMAQFAADQRPPDPEAAAILEECQSELMGEPVHSTDPVAVALREAIPAEDVPEWALWVTWDGDGVYGWRDEPFMDSRFGPAWMDGRADFMCLSDTPLPAGIAWTTTKRRVADVWKGGGE